MPYFFHLLRRHLGQYPARVAVALLVLTVASALMLGLAGVGAALRFRLAGYLTELYPEELLRLEAARVTLGPMAIEGKSIDDATLLKAAARPEAAQVLSVEAARFPIRIEGTLFGQDYTSDAVVYGVARDLVDDALTPADPWAAPAAGKPMPVVVSRYFLDIYNLGLARSSGLPLLSVSAVKGRPAKLILNESAIGLGEGRHPSVTYLARVVGMTAQPAMLGLALPAEVVREFNRLYAPTPDPVYVQLVVRLKKGADREAFLAWAREQKLVLSGGDVLGGRLKTGVRMAGWGLIGLAAAVFALGMLTFYQLFAMTFHARRLDLMRLRALGFSPGGAVGLALGEVGSLALVAVALAALGVGLLAAWGDRAARPWLEQLGWLPPDLLAPAPGWLALAALAILALTLLPALPMLRWVVRTEPAQAIRDL